MIHAVVRPAVPVSGAPVTAAVQLSVGLPVPSLADAGRASLCRGPVTGVSARAIRSRFRERRRPLAERPVRFPRAVRWPGGLRGVAGEPSEQVRGDDKAEQREGWYDPDDLPERFRQQEIAADDDDIKNRTNPMSSAPRPISERFSADAK